MCQQLVETIEHLCHHRVDCPGTIREWKGCNNCGIIKEKAHLGKLTKRYPCPDCIANGVWVKKNGKWDKVKPKA
ncbi:uncharacterized protein N7473_010073 [Penicillium subrubescens]|uniref:Uncharacterized protein n=1 Tax=Penicillium subrubescens TaxID=1316194 RepID=A0A1Q5U1L6_9EURO|nr:uncharacterized protein N7473_010073 [Penicillium subrubescens]KAJ5883187.1 hypothetical protein N7473_010073 [Penicillium subrubescens]OKP06357.1 hypothetical protein PENSUB_6347 [Penicillium subrubescens]